MTPEQITKWAAETGMTPVSEFGYTRFASPKQLQAFANIVRNATLEEAAVVVMEAAYRSNGTSSYEHVAEKIRSMKHDQD